MGYIGRHGIETLHRYKYSGVDRSYVAKYVLQPFWSRCVNLFPLWMPPNMITLLGFLFVVTSALLSYSLLFLPLAIANALSAKLLGGIPLIDERLLLLGYCTFTIALYMHFAVTVIHEITSALCIQCFRITRKEA